MAMEAKTVQCRRHHGIGVGDEPHPLVSAPP
jgi:hypothetical protein